VADAPFLDSADERRAILQLRGQRRTCTGFPHDGRRDHSRAAMPFPQPCALAHGTSRPRL